MNPSIEGYELVDELGRGGMGTVWLARQKSTRRQVALKILSRTDTEAEQRFMREIRLMLGLRHPNIIQFLDCGENASALYFAMELVRGQTLQALHEDQGPLAPVQLVAVLDQSLGALQCCHQNGILHRDIKPLNIMQADDGRIVLMDLGLASSQQMTMLTRTGALVGTPRYLAPELIAGERATAATDVYGLGVTMDQLATVSPPFGSGNLSEVAAAILGQELPALTTLRPEMSPHLAEAIDGMVRKDAAARPTIGQLLEVMEVAKARPSVPVRRSRGSMGRAASGSSGTVAPVTPGAGLSSAGPVTPLSGWIQERRGSFVLGLVGGLVMMGVAGSLVLRRPDPLPVVASVSPDGPESKPGPTVSPAAAAFDLHHALLSLDRAIDDVKDLIKSAKQGSADVVDTSSAAERKTYQQGVERTFRLLGEVLEVLERGKTFDPNDVAWLEFEQLVARLLNVLGDLDAGREGSPLRTPIERVRKSLAGIAASPDFRGSFVRIASTRLTCLVQSGPEAETRRREAYQDAYLILDQQDPAWKRTIPSIHYRVDLLHRVYGQWDRWEYIALDPEMVRESGKRKRDIADQMVKICNDNLATLDREMTLPKQDAQDVVSIAVMTTRTLSDLLSESKLEGAERDLGCALLEHFRSLLFSIKAKKEREKLGDLLEETRLPCGG